MEDQRCRAAVTSQNGCLKAWIESRGIALNREDGNDVHQGQLIIAPDETAKEGEEANVLELHLIMVKHIVFVNKYLIISI